MPNFFTDNEDLKFHFNRLDLREILAIQEDNYEQKKEFDFAPENYEDAMINLGKTLELIGDISGNKIAPRAASVDEEGAHFKDGIVTYAKGTIENLKELSQADLSGMILPRKYGGLNAPITIYMAAAEIMARADGGLTNIFGLQDIADMIKKYGTEEQKAKYIPKFSTGEHTGAMALTEPDAGSDLQACKLRASQDENGQWRLNGMKRFITNGNGDVHLVLSRTEAGTKDGRGLSMLACYNDDTVVVRRIENKLGIHGSPTCELQYNNTPAELIGNRRFGLIKYTIDLMFRARLGVAAQALGISEAAYGEALKYSKEREQFGKTIYEIPAVKNILLDMRVLLETGRSILYDTAKLVDIKEKLEGKIELLKTAGEPVKDLNDRLKELTKVANLLTPILKYVTTEASNKITYDAIQIHGGTGYMKEFPVERLARDARITNIYEGTSQLQIVAAIGGVINDILKDYFDKKAAKTYSGGLERLNNFLKEIREIFYESLKYVVDRKDNVFQDVAAKDLVELYSYIYTGYLVLEEAEELPRKKFIANRYIITSLANAKKNAESIKSELFSDLLHADEILI
ncbi:MAG: acyl-CoA dehydrogenase family protein [Melioribacteraceae bacterium]|jgi:alkylation response protein AidB-like acyl-CoA dehydrogenase|nr:acyl-CoA dehydrogenase family protein [Melioribacteraceae bacterium]